MSERTPTGQPPPNGGPLSREAGLATVRSSAATQQETYSPRVAPSGPPLQPRLGPDQVPPVRPQPVAEQPNGFRPVPVQPGGAAAGAMPPPPEVPYALDQQRARGQASRRPAVPVWDPPAQPRPKRSLREWLGFGTKSDAKPRAKATSAAAAAVGTNEPMARHAARSDVANPPVAAPAAGAAVATETPPIEREDQAKQAQPTEHLEPTQRVQPVGPAVPPAPGATPVEPANEPNTGPLPAVGDAPTAHAGAAVAAALPGPEQLAPTTRQKPGAPRRTRKARLRLSRMDPWSVMKTSFLFSIAAGIMLVVAVYTVWTVLESSGLFESINDIVASVVSTPGDTTPFRVQDYVNTQKVMGVAALIACVDVVIFTALATLGSFLYNLAATMLGGLEITLAED